MPAILGFFLSACFLALPSPTPISALNLASRKGSLATQPTLPGWRLPCSSVYWKQGRCNAEFQLQALLNDDCEEQEVVSVSGTKSIDASTVPLRSRISCIRSYNLASVVNADSPGESVCFAFMDHDNDNNIGPSRNPNLVAVTGETGTGKSLLVARVVELLTGSKAAASFVTPCTVAATNGDSDGQKSLGDPTASVEMELLLRGPHLKTVSVALERIGIDPGVLFFGITTVGSTTQKLGKLILKRKLVLQQQQQYSSTPTSSTSGTTTKARLKSVCEINGVAVTLKAMAELASPLFAIVDATTAAGALAKGDSRMAVIDTSVSISTLTAVIQTKTRYRQCRQTRENLQNELASRTLPQGFSSVSSDSSEKDLELLSHWIDELDAFEARVARFCKALGSRDDSSGNASSLETLVKDIMSTEWMDNASTSKGHGFSSSLYMKLDDLREALKILDDQLVAARKSSDALALLSSPESAITAVERARDLLFDATQGETASDERLSAAAERSHELLNAAELALQKCARFLEDDEQGLIRTLEATRSTVAVSVEDFDDVLLDWNTLSRKHGISSYTLPSCHKALQSERDGNAEARTLLPKAMAAEKVALADFQHACLKLTEERRCIAKTLSASVTERLPFLGMGQSVFRVNLVDNARACTDFSAYATGSTTLGVDGVEFLLLHGDDTSTDSTGSRRGGAVHQVGSAGEKARILLAIECALPGSVGASCGSGGGGSAAVLSESSSESSTNMKSDHDENETANYVSKAPLPIAVLYDEIDAHVGGRAAVSLASMLVDQSLSCQVVAITHSPSVAAVADLHIVIHKAATAETTTASDGMKTTSRLSSNWVRVAVVDGADRRTELARMASGDLAVNEAEIFADALIRDGTKRREESQQQQQRQQKRQEQQQQQQLEL
jgi:DNA repair ATPase RecN